MSEYNEFQDDEDLYDDEDEGEGDKNAREDEWDEEKEKPKSEHKTKKSRRSSLEWIIIIALAVVFAVSAFHVISIAVSYGKAKSEYEELDLYIEATSEEQQETEENRYPDLDIDYDALKEINSDFVGVISIPVLDLVYPVVQTDDNTTYLNTTFEGTTNSSGCIFLDSLASPDFSSWNTFVFGHNMKNMTMFGSLKLFQQDEDLCDTNPYIYIYQEDQVLIYRIFAYYTIPVDDDVYLDFEDEEGYDAYVEDALYHSIYSLDEEVVNWEERPNLLTLSTCYATGHVNNFIVQGVCVDVVEQ